MSKVADDICQYLDEFEAECIAEEQAQLAEQIVAALFASELTATEQLAVLELAKSKVQAR